MSNKADIIVPQRYELALLNDFIKEGAAHYWKNQFGLVTVSFELCKNGDPATDTPIGIGTYELAVLPEGFRPIGYYAHSTGLANSKNGFAPVLVWVFPDGKLMLRIKTASYEVSDTFSFYA